MNKVVTISLSGNAFQVDEEGYERLHAYLARADALLAANPDRSEIIKDLEQAVAEKCLRYLGRGKTVVAAAEIDQILREMGPVDAGAGPPPAADGSSSGEFHPRQLYQIREGAMISGVCNGIAAYLNIDPTIIRVVFVVLALLHGVGLGLYLLLMFIVPYAKTSHELAAAQGRHAELPYRVQRAVEKIKGKLFGKTTPKGAASHDAANSRS